MSDYLKYCMICGHDEIPHRGEHFKEALKAVAAYGLLAIVIGIICVAGGLIT